MNQAADSEVKLKDGILDKQELAERGREQIERKGLNLPQWDHEKTKLDSFILVIGKRRYGKSTWARWLLWHMWWFFPSGAYVFTKTKHNWFWQQHVPDSRIYNGFKADVVAKILAEQKRKYSQFLEGEAPQDAIPFVVMIFDDVISEKSLRYEELLNEIVYSGRHYFIFMIVCTQDCKGLPPGVRQNADIVACTWQTQERAIESITRDYADIFPDKDLFKEILKHNTTDHGILLIDQTDAKYDASDIFFVDKAEEKPPAFRLGDKQFWRESGCDWKKQLEKCERVPHKEKKDWDNIAKQRLAKDKKEEEFEDPDLSRIATNMISLAPRETRDRYYEQEPQEGAFRKAWKMFDDKVMFKYISPPK